MEIILKTTMFEILQEVVAFNNISTSSELLISKPYLAFVFIAPSVVVRFYTNLIYGTLLVISVYMKQLNSYLVDIMTRADYVNGLNTGRKKRVWMDKYYDFSDQIDKLSVTYVQLVQTTKTLNSIFSIQIAFWNVTIIITLTVQFLFQFITIRELIHKGYEATMLNMFALLAILLSIFDLLTISNAGERIVNAVHSSTV